MSDANQQLAVLFYAGMCFVALVGLVSLSQQLWPQWERGETQGLWAGGLLGASLSLFSGLIVTRISGVGFVAGYVTIVGTLLGAMFGAAIGARAMPLETAGDAFRFRRIEPFWTRRHDLPSFRRLMTPPTPYEVASWSGRQVAGALRWMLGVPETQARPPEIEDIPTVVRQVARTESESREVAPREPIDDEPSPEPNRARRPRRRDRGNRRDAGE